MDKMREEFEDWAISEEYSVERYGDGYVFHYTNEAWGAWKASRAALCVELPLDCNAEQEDYKRFVMDYLDGAGVKYK